MSRRYRITASPSPAKSPSAASEASATQLHSKEHLEEHRKPTLPLFAAHALFLQQLLTYK